MCLTVLATVSSSAFTRAADMFVLAVGTKFSDKEAAAVHYNSLCGEVEFRKSVHRIF